MPLQPFPIVRAEHMTNQPHVNIIIVPLFVQTLARPAHMRKERLQNGTKNDNGCFNIVHMCDLKKVLNLYLFYILFLYLKTIYPSLKEEKERGFGKFRLRAINKSLSSVCPRTRIRTIQSKERSNNCVKP